MQKLRSIVGILLIAAGCFTAFKVIPVMYANLRFQQYLDETARQACYTPASDQEIAAATVARAQELELPVVPEQVIVERNGGDVGIRVDYTVSVDLIVRTFDLNFRPAAKNHRV